MTARVCYGLLIVFSLLLPNSMIRGEDPFPDQKLESVIREILKKKQIEKENIEPADLKTIFFLDARKAGIADLTGLEHCVNLAEVKLSDNEIVSVQPLAGLKNIQSLYLSRNKIQDIAPLKELVKLQYLELEGNEIDSLDPLQGLENMRSLYLSANKITDVTPLKGLTKLRSLYLNENQLTDLSPLADLKWVSTLGLKSNKLTDLRPLAGFSELRYTFLEGNPLEDLSPLVEMARQDVEGPRRFAPYWYLYVDAEKLPEGARNQLDELRQLGVRVNRR